MYFVYKIIFPNHQIYIGITKNLNLRFSQHQRSKYLCGKLIRFFGKDNSIFEPIFNGTLKECQEIEELLVDQSFLNSWRSANMTLGGAAGAGFTDHKHSEQSKLMIKNSLTGRVMSDEHKRKIGIKTKERMIGCKLSESHTAAITNSVRQRYENMSKEEKRAKHGHMLNKNHSSETKQKISLAHQKGSNHHNAKSIIMIDLDGNEKEFGSVVLASRYLCTGTDSITKCLTGKCKTGYGYFWKYKDIKRM